MTRRSKVLLKRKISLEAFTEPLQESFFRRSSDLEHRAVEHYPAATDYIPEMIEIIEKLVKEGTAYKAADGSIYFAIRNFPPMADLSHLHLSELKEGASERLIR